MGSTVDMRHAFADCVFDTDSHFLTRAGNPVRVEPQVFDLLRLLIENAGRLVATDELIAEVWGGRIVSDSAISARIAAARRAVGDDGKAQAIIRTVPRRGLQFVAALDTREDAPASRAPAARQEDRPSIRYAAAKDGASIAYAVNGTGPPLIRSMHFPTHLELLWGEPIERESVSRLARHHTVIRYDHRGCGLSDRDLTGYAYEQIAGDIIAVADAAGLGRFALMGMSSGARNAVAAAALYPDRVSHLVLQGGYVDGRALRQASPEPILSMIKQGWDQQNQAFTRAYMAMYFPDAPQDWLANAGRIAQGSASSETAALVREHSNTSSIADFLPGVRAPTLILHSRDDAIHPVSEARKMAAGIAGSELVILDSPNHYLLPHEADWDFHLGRILEFLSTGPAD